MSSAGSLAVALHDVEPATFERCALIRDWLTDHGVDRVTLLVIPARDLHPFFQRRPDLAAWLLDCRDQGDAIAQHGLAHQQRRRAGGLRRLAAGGNGAPAEFCGLDPDETRESVAAGRRILTLAGLEPRGFVAPAYAYPMALRRELAGRFDWWATLLRVRGAERAGTSPVLALGTSNLLERRVSALMVHTRLRLHGGVVRLDLHPADFDHPRRVQALERALVRARTRRAITYDDLCAHADLTSARLPSRGS